MTGPVTIIRCRFSQIIKSCPDKLTHIVRQRFIADEIIFWQIAPWTMFQVIRRSLMVFIFSHGTPHHRKLIDTSRTDCRCRFRSQNHLLRQFFISHFIFMRTIIKSGHIYHRRHMRVNGCFHTVHAHCTGARRVLAVYDILHHPA